jgi:hypothetical protein
MTPFGGPVVPLEYMMVAGDPLFSKVVREAISVSPELSVGPFRFGVIGINNDYCDAIRVSFGPPVTQIRRHVEFLRYLPFERPA